MASTDIDLIEKALFFIPADDRDIWLKVGMALKSELCEAGFDLWDKWSQSANNYNKNDGIATWNSIEALGGINIGTLFYLAQGYGYKKTLAQKAPVFPKAIWDKASPCISHRYLDLKKVKPHGIRTISSILPECHDQFWWHDKIKDKWYQLEGELLLIPYLNLNYEIVGLQAIDNEGRKSYQKGVKKSGLFFLIGNFKQTPLNYTGLIYISEGFATAATIHEITNELAVSAFDSNNLKHVAKIICCKFPKAKIVIAGDFDKNGNGQKKAIEASSKINGFAVFPNFTKDELNGILGGTETSIPSDFNDLYLLHGKERVKNNLEQFGKKSLDNKTIPNVNLNLISARNETPKSIQWLWKGWLASGKLQLVAGVPGTGKTTIALSFAATVSSGGYWPDGTSCEAKNVLIWSGEDDFNDTILPRFISQGGNRDNFYFVGDIENGDGIISFDPAKHLDLLLLKAKEIGNVGLLIIDPIVNVVQGDSNQNNQVRRALHPLVELGNELNCSVLGITHLTKGTIGKDPLERITGSVAFGALARIVLGTTRKKEDNGLQKNLFVRAKSNIGASGGGFYYDIHQNELEGYPGLFASNILWNRQMIEGSPHELLVDTLYSTNDENHSALAEAKEFLVTVLKNGPVPQKDIQLEIKAAGLSEPTIRRAKYALGIKSKKVCFNTESQWFWELPHKPLLTKHDHEDVHSKNVSALDTFDNNDHLRNNMKMIKSSEGDQDDQDLDMVPFVSNFDYVPGRFNDNAIPSGDHHCLESSELETKPTIKRIRDVL